MAGCGINNHFLSSANISLSIYKNENYYFINVIIKTLHISSFILVDFHILHIVNIVAKSGRIGKVVAQHAEGCKVARSNPGRG